MREKYAGYYKRLQRFQDSDSTPENSCAESEKFYFYFGGIFSSLATGAWEILRLMNDLTTWRKSHRH